MFSTPERFRKLGVVNTRPSVTMKNPSARKLLHIFAEVFYVKNNAYICWVGASKSNKKSIRSGSMFCSSIPNRRGHKKINERTKTSLYNWILQHPQVVQYPIANGCLKMSIDSHYKSRVVTKNFCKCLSGNFIISW